MKIWLPALLAVILVFSLLAASCSAPEVTTPVETSTPSVTEPVSSPSGTLTPTPQKGGTLRWAGPLDPGGPFGWPSDVSVTAFPSAQPVLESLLHQNSDGSFSPWLASYYRVSADKLSITLYLRQGVRFHDGTEFDAAAVKYNFDDQIKKNNVAAWKSVEILSPYVVKVNLWSWTNGVLATFADTSSGLIASPTSQRRHNREWSDMNPIGTGPFKFVSYEANSKMIFIRNSDYWQAGKPYLDNLEIIYLPDFQTKKAKFLAGEIDILNVSLGKQQSELSQPNFTVYMQAQTTYCLVPDTANADSPFANQLVRQAVERSLNREALAKTLGAGFMQATYQLPPRDNAAFNSKFSLGLGYDPSRARQLLVQAGFRDGIDTSLICSPYSKNSDANAEIQSYLKAVGIRAELKNVDADIYVKYQTEGWLNALLIQPVLGFPNYNNSLAFYFGPAASQFKSWGKTEQFLDDYASSVNAAAQDADLIRKVTDSLIQNTSVIPVFESGLGMAAAGFVKNGGFCTRSSAMCWDLDSTWLEK